jgi:protein TonB
LYKVRQYGVTVWILIGLCLSLLCLAGCQPKALPLMSDKDPNVSPPPNPPYVPEPPEEEPSTEPVDGLPPQFRLKTADQWELPPSEGISELPPEQPSVPATTPPDNANQAQPGKKPQPMSAAPRLEPKESAAPRGENPSVEAGRP